MLWISGEERRFELILWCGVCTVRPLPLARGAAAPRPRPRELQAQSIAISNCVILHCHPVPSPPTGTRTPHTCCVRWCLSLFSCSCDTSQDCLFEEWKASSSCIHNALLVTQRPRSSGACSPFRNTCFYFRNTSSSLFSIDYCSYSIYVMFIK